MNYDYLRWMSAHTSTRWCNDSAMPEDLLSALAAGATGCTSNPPLSHQSLTENPLVYSNDIARIPADLSPDERALALMSLVVRHLSGLLYPLFVASGGRDGYIRAQVQPSLSGNASAMLEMGRRLASIGRNVMVKIPGTAAGVWVLEELAALGIPTNPTVCVSVSQMVAVAEAYERGGKRARAAGIPVTPCTAAMVMGRLQDHLTDLNEAAGRPLPASDLDRAALAVCKRCCRIYRERGFGAVVMPAAFRSAEQVAKLAGSNTVMTIHPKVQQQVSDADAAGVIARKEGFDDPDDEGAIARVSDVFPDFSLAYEENGLSVQEFDRFPPTVKTLAGFDRTGWQKLRAL